MINYIFSNFIDKKTNYYYNIVEKNTFIKNIQINLLNLKIEKKKVKINNFKGKSLKEKMHI